MVQYRGVRRYSAKPYCVLGYLHAAVLVLIQGLKTCRMRFLVCLTGVSGRVTGRFTKARFLERTMPSGLRT